MRKQCSWAARKHKGCQNSWTAVETHKLAEVSHFATPGRRQKRKVLQPQACPLPQPRTFRPAAIGSVRMCAPKTVHSEHLRAQGRPAYLAALFHALRQLGEDQLYRAPQSRQGLSGPQKLQSNPAQNRSCKYWLVAQGPSQDDVFAHRPRPSVQDGPAIDQVCRNVHYRRTSMFAAHSPRRMRTRGKTASQVSSGRVLTDNR